MDHVCRYRLPGRERFRHVFLADPRQVSTPGGLPASHPRPLRGGFPGSSPLRATVRSIEIRSVRKETTHMGRFGAFGILFLLVFALVVGGIGYSLGVGAGPAAATASGTVVYPVGFWHPFGLVGGLFGILFFFLFIGLIVAALRPRVCS